MESQPMQMFYMATSLAAEAGLNPGLAPLMVDPHQIVANGEVVWPTGTSQWTSLSHNICQELPSPMDCEYHHGSSFSQATPTQLQMDIMSSSRAAQQPSESTLRRRHPSETPMQTPQIETASKSDAEGEEEQGRESQMANELLSQLGMGGELQRSALQRFQYFAFSSKLSSRAAQIALVNASSHDAALLASGLRGQVRSAAQSKHANYVVQRIVEVMPMARASFVVEELLRFVHEIACHRFGCRLLCRILEHLSPDDKLTLKLIEELLANVRDLCSHTYGSYVARHILEFGLPEHKHRVAAVLVPQAAFYAKHRLASHTVEAALKFCSPEDQRALAEALLVHDKVATLATHQFGRHVVRSLLSMPELKLLAENALKGVDGQIKNSRYGRGILHSSGLARSRF
jgi:hypothetical protein